MHFRSFQIWYHELANLNAFCAYNPQLCTQKFSRSLFSFSCSTRVSQPVNGDMWRVLAHSHPVVYLSAHTAVISSTSGFALWLLLCYRRIANISSRQTVREYIMAPAPLPASPAPTFPLSTAVKSKTTFENADDYLSSYNVYLYYFKSTKFVFSYYHNKTINCLWSPV